MTKLSDAIHPLDFKAPYWICGRCADERGGVYFKSVSTASEVGCEYCAGKNQIPNEFCFPVVDYKWPKKGTNK